MAKTEARKASKEHLSSSAHQSEKLSFTWAMERCFTLLFQGLVYPQIWEDPVVDMKGLELTSGKSVMTISSGGCNALSYLSADPEFVHAVDLNDHHINLLKLKRDGLRYFPNYQTYYRFFGSAQCAGNIRAFDRHVRDHLDIDCRHYWQQRDILLRRRVSLFERNIYRFGLLGRFISVGRWGAYLLGVRLSEMLEMPNREAQLEFFEREISPVFDHWAVRRVTAARASLFGLGIPPAQYESLAREGDGSMADVLRIRLRKLFGDFALQDNYFAMQALTHSYGVGPENSLPPYLQPEHYHALKSKAERLSVSHRTYSDELKERPEHTFDCYLLLDAQDWMSNKQLDHLWSQIIRTSRPGARVLFRTADKESLLPGRLDDDLLARFAYLKDLSEDLTKQDRAAVYGGVHVYQLKP